MKTFTFIQDELQWLEEERQKRSALYEAANIICLEHDLRPELEFRTKTQQKNYENACAIFKEEVAKMLASDKLHHLASYFDCRGREIRKKRAELRSLLDTIPIGENQELPKRKPR